MICIEMLLFSIFCLADKEGSVRELDCYHLATPGDQKYCWCLRKKKMIECPWWKWILLPEGGTYLQDQIKTNLAEKPASDQAI